MKQVFKKTFLFATVLVILSLPIMAIAVDATPTETVDIPPLLINLVATFTNWITYLAGALCVFFIVLAGINFIWNGGDESKLKTAKNQILYAAVGFGIVTLAQVIKGIIDSLAALGD